MSAKWRRSKKHLKWLDLKSALKMTPKTRPRTIRLENIKTSNTRNLSPKKYRIPKKFEKSKLKEPKPLIDIFQDQNWMTIIAQIAGFNQETLKVTIKNRKLTLTAKAKDKQYYKSLNLPKVVIPAVAHTTYKNGVLEIKLKKTNNQTIKQTQAGLKDAS